MPVAHNPSRPEFYVYALQVRGVPFYVGEGRSARASDRVRFVRYLMSRKASGKSVKWVFSSRLVREFLRRGEEVKVVYVHKGLTREQALTFEREEIEKLLSAGFLLGNQQHNSGRSLSVEKVVQSVLSRATNAEEALQPETSRNSASIEPVRSRTAVSGKRRKLPETEILKQPVYDTVVVATNKETRPSYFFHCVKEAAVKPIVLRKLIQYLTASYRPPFSKKDPNMVIRVRTRDAYTRLGYLREDK